MSITRLVIFFRVMLWWEGSMGAGGRQRIVVSSKYLVRKYDICADTQPKLINVRIHISQTFATTIAFDYQFYLCIKYVRYINYTRYVIPDSEDTIHSRLAPRLTRASYFPKCVPDNILQQENRLETSHRQRRNDWIGSTDCRCRLATIPSPASSRNTISTAPRTSSNS
jgi:hypothetical protein